MEFTDLKSQYNLYKNEIDNAIHAVIDSGSFIMGKEVGLLEQELSDFVGVKHSISCSSGTDALILSLMAAGVQPEDQVITTPFSFIATAEAIAFLKAIPVFVDIEEDTFNIDVTKLEKVITHKTKAIIPVSLYGQPSDMDEINELAAVRNIAVIEDGAQSFGAEYKGKKSGNLSKLACTSFFPAKPLGCYGDGGAVFTNDDDLALKIKMLRNHGQNKRYHHQLIGINGRMDTLQAAILRVKLERYPEEIRNRQNYAARYTHSLFEKYKTPAIKNDRTSVYAQYTIRCENREIIMQKLTDNKIPFAVHYPVPLPFQEAFQYLGYRTGEFPIAGKMSREVLSLPIGNIMKDEDIEKVIETLL